MRRQGLALLLLAACGRSAGPEIDYAVGLLTFTSTQVAAEQQRAAAIAALPEAPEAEPRTPPSDRVVEIDTSGAVSFGPADAPVTLVVATQAFDMQAARLAPTLEQLGKRFPSQLRIAFMLLVVREEPNLLATLGLCAAARQSPEAFARLERRLWQEKKLPAQGGDEVLVRLAGELGLDVARFRGDLADPACRQRLDGDKAHLAAAGVTRTPTVLVAGRYQRSQSFDSLSAAVEAALTR